MEIQQKIVSSHLDLASYASFSQTGSLSIPRDIMATLMGKINRNCPRWTTVQLLQNPSVPVVLNLWNQKPHALALQSLHTDCLKALEKVNYKQIDYIKSIYIRISRFPARNKTEYHAAFESLLSQLMQLPLLELVELDLESLRKDPILLSRVIEILRAAQVPQLQLHSLRANDYPLFQSFLSSTAPKGKRMSSLSIDQLSSRMSDQEQQELEGTLLSQFIPLFPFLKRIQITALNAQIDKENIPEHVRRNISFFSMQGGVDYYMQELWETFPRIENMEVFNGNGAIDFFDSREDLWFKEVAFLSGNPVWPSDVVPHFAGRHGAAVESLSLVVESDTNWGISQAILWEMKGLKSLRLQFRAQVDPMFDKIPKRIEELSIEAKTSIDAFNSLIAFLSDSGAKKVSLSLDARSSGSERERFKLPFDWFLTIIDSLTRNDNVSEMNLHMAIYCNGRSRREAIGELLVRLEMEKKKKRELVVNGRPLNELTRDLTLLIKSIGNKTARSPFCLSLVY